MKKKTIFKTLALAMMMPAMLLTTACSSSDDDSTINNENTNKNGYALPVTINVTRESDATRALYNGTSKKLEFSAGDQLFVKGTHASAGKFAGTLLYESDGTFSGTIFMQNYISTTVGALLSEASTTSALLLPDGYYQRAYLSTNGSGYDADVSVNASNAFTSDKARAVEQFSFEHAYAYDKINNCFALSPQNAILNFTISGLTAEATDIPVSLTGIGGLAINETVNADPSGNATFAVGIDVTQNDDLDDLTLSVGVNAINLGSHELVAGKIYNVSRVAAPSLADAFVNGNTTTLDFNCSFGTLTLSAEYDSGVFGDVTSNGTGAEMLSDASMEKKGNNLVITVIVTNPFNPTSTLTGNMTIDTANNTYKWSNASVGAMINLNSITIGGNPITPLPTVAN